MTSPGEIALAKSIGGTAGEGSGWRSAGRSRRTACTTACQMAITSPPQARAAVTLLKIVSITCGRIAVGKRCTSLRTRCRPGGCGRIAVPSLAAGTSPSARLANKAATSDHGTTQKPCVTGTWRMKLIWPRD